ncbi:flagellar basal body-associated FliL family protein [Paenibacillus senegalensis]|uniref:flagellar basal body-associated FliL family protein n=1 Tax=Paenibacillus senegalensis TaxID=1465766 RepID=UPI000289E3D4|nr:flagellar basal body-associated FliL family protein [Paenibacillus senegalensis]
MLKSKVFQIVVAMLIVVTLILTASVLVWNLLDQKNSRADSEVPAAALPSEVKEMTYFMDDIITNLSGSNRIVKVGFAFEMSTLKAREDFEHLDFKVKGIINQTLADLTPDDINGSEGQEKLTSLLADRIAPILPEGSITNIWITELVFQ